jgi:hypothetical protein
MNPKSAFILTAAIVVTYSLIIGLSAAQPANAKKTHIVLIFLLPLEVTVVRLSKNAKTAGNF